MVVGRHGKETQQINLRVPMALKERVEAWAAKNNRSINSELLSTLEAAYPAPPEPETLNEELVRASFDVAAAWSVALKALGQDPKKNDKLERLMMALEKANAI